MNHQEFFETWEQYGIRTKEGLIPLADIFSFPISIEQDGVQFDGGVQHQGGIAPMLRCEIDENVVPEKRYKLFRRDTFPGTWIFEGYLEKLPVSKKAGEDE